MSYTAWNATEPKTFRVRFEPHDNYDAGFLKTAKKLTGWTPNTTTEEVVVQATDKIAAQLASGINPGFRLVRYWEIQSDGSEVELFHS